jgi:hypothetical protein
MDADTQDKRQEPYYTKHYSIVMNALAEMDITLVDGMLHRPLTPKLTIKDATGMVIDHIARKKLPPIQQGIIVNLIAGWVGDASRKEFAEVLGKIKYDPTVPDMWNDLMQVTFLRNDDCDRWALKHQVWLMKRRMNGLQVCEIHRPMLFNIAGQADQGKSLFLNEYLLTPVPKARRAEVNDMALYMDERHYDLFGDNFAVLFTETAKGEKTNVEQLKNLLDREYLGRRDLGHNTHSRYRNSATLFATSNSRLRDMLKEEKPRKWYEVEFPTRSSAEIKEYIAKRNAIPVFDLWRCIDETQDSELMRNWDQVHSRIIQTCGYIPMAEKWILEHVIECGKPIIGKVVPLWQTYQSKFLESGKGEYATTPERFKAKAEELGFVHKRTMNSRGFVLYDEGYQRICKRYEAVFDRPAIGVLDAFKASTGGAQ